MIRAWRYVAGRAGREETPVDHVHDGWDPEHAVLWIDAEGDDKDQLQALKAELGMGAAMHPASRLFLQRGGKIRRRFRLMTQADSSGCSIPSNNFP